MNARVGIIFPQFQWGGAEAVFVWMIEALKAEHEVSAVVWDAVDIAAIDGFYGTRLGGSRVEWIAVQDVARPRALLPLARRSFTTRQSLVASFVRSMQSRFDLLISAFNEMDMGRPGVQYIHFPLFLSGATALRRQVGYPSSLAHGLARRLLQQTLGWSTARVRANRTLANSQWTASTVREAYAINAEVVYPPVWSRFPEVAWENREDGFVMISRGVPEKRIERAARILQAVRQRGLAVHLHIVGDMSAERVRAVLNETRSRHEDWLHLEGRLPREDVSHLLASHKYGIHVRDFEQFGIAVAEMVAAGCIPFVPGSGGQTEIVAGYPGITFASDADAVDKIGTVTADSTLQSTIRRHLRQCADRFSAARFCAAIRTVTEQELTRLAH